MNNTGPSFRVDDIVPINIKGYKTEHVGIILGVVQRPNKPDEYTVQDYLLGYRYVMTEREIREEWGHEMCDWLRKAIDSGTHQFKPKPLLYDWENVGGNR